MKRKLSIAWKRNWFCWIPVLLLAALIDMKVQITIQTKKYFFISKVKSVKGERSKISTKRLLTWYNYKTPPPTSTHHLTNCLQHSNENNSINPSQPEPRWRGKINLNVKFHKNLVKWSLSMKTLSRHLPAQS